MRSRLNAAFALFIAISAATTPLALADPLTEVLRDSDSTNLSATKDEWFVGQENRRRLFSSRLEPELLASWIAPERPGVYRIVDQIFTASRESARAEIELLLPAGQKIEVTVLVPHPRVMEAVKLGVAREFTQLLATGNLKAISITERSPINEAPSNEEPRFKFFGDKELAQLATSQLNDGTVVRAKFLPNERSTAQSSQQFVAAVMALDLRRLTAKLAE